MERAAETTRKQLEKGRYARLYRVGEYVWTKLHRRSDQQRKKTRKLFLIHQGPYRIKREVRPNTYLIEEIGPRKRIIGVYNMRQMRPHRIARMKAGRPENNRDYDKFTNTSVEETMETRYNELASISESTENEIDELSND